MPRIHRRDFGRRWNAFSMGMAAGAVLLAVHLSATPLWAVITSNVNVDATNVTATMPITGIGIHTSPSCNTMANANLDEQLEETGVTTLRFGGGGYADVNHWSITIARGSKTRTGTGSRNIALL